MTYLSSEVGIGPGKAFVSRNVEMISRLADPALNILLYKKESLDPWQIPNSMADSWQHRPRALTAIPLELPACARSPASDENLGPLGVLWEPYVSILGQD